MKKSKFLVWIALITLISIQNVKCSLPDQSIFNILLTKVRKDQRNHVTYFFNSHYLFHLYLLLQQEENSLSFPKTLNEKTKLHIKSKEEFQSWLLKKKSNAFVELNFFNVYRNVCSFLLITIVYFLSNFSSLWIVWKCNGRRN